MGRRNGVGPGYCTPSTGFRESRQEGAKSVVAHHDFAGIVAGQVTDFLLSSPFEETPRPAASQFGFRFGGSGGHASRTLMLDELEMLMDATANTAPAPDDWRKLCIEDNVLAKPTLHTRGATLQRLREMYGMDDKLPLFRVFRALWEAEKGGRPLLAMMLALCRDPIFRVSAPVILRAAPGDPVPRDFFTAVFGQALGSRYKETMIDKLVRHVGSSWVQTGHLKGRIHKTRQKAEASPAAVTFALLAAHLLSLRGQALLNTVFTRLLDSSAEEILSLAREARRLNLLELREAGDVIEISFPRLLTSDETFLSYGQS